jgi:hypothetical protein
LEDLDMFGFRFCLLVALVVATTSVTSAEDYVLPTGVTVLTEEQLLNQIIGNTLVGGYENWVEYFEPPTGDQKKGMFKGKTARGAGRYGYGGSWEVKGVLMCLQWDLPQMAYLNKCITTVLDGDIITWYKSNGAPWYNKYRQIKLSSGNPKNF